MQGLKKRCTFFGYYRAVCDFYAASFPKAIKKFLPLILFDALMLFAVLQMKTFALGQGYLNFVTLTCVFGFFLFGVFAYSGVLLDAKPSLKSVCPLGYRRRAAYTFLVNVLIALVLFLISNAALIAVGFMPIIIYSVLALEFRPLIELTKMLFYAGSVADASGVAFTVLYGLMTLAAGFALSQIRRAKYKNLLAGGLAAIMTVISQVAVNTIGDGGYVIRGDALGNFAAVPVNWLYLAILAAGVIGFSVYGIIFALKNTKPKNF